MNSPSAAETVFLKFSCRKLEQMADRIGTCLNALAEEQVWQRANEHSNAVGNLVLHLAGNVRQWLVSGVGQQPDLRQRDAEFAARAGQAKDDLRQVLNQTIQEAIVMLQALPAARLTELVEIQGFRLTALEAIYHVVEHFSGHTFQIIMLTKAHCNAPLDFYGYLSGPHENETP